MLDFNGMILLNPIAELFGASADGTVGIECDVGIEVGEKRGIVFLLEMNVGEKTVDDGDVGGEAVGFLGRSESLGKLLLVEEEAAELIVAEPEIGVERNPLANEFFGLRKIGAIGEEAAEVDVGGSVGVAAGSDGLPEGDLGFRGFAEGEVGDAELIGGLEISWGDGESELVIGEGALGVLVLIEFFVAGGEGFASFAGHGEFVGGDGGLVRGFGIVFFNERLESELEHVYDLELEVDSELDGFVPGDLNADNILRFLEIHKAKFAGP